MKHFTMFAKSIIALAAVASLVSAAPVEKKDGASDDWASGYLEDYETYHIRYLALKCWEKHDTTYFQDCCRPMLSTENIWDNRKAYCRPAKEDTAYVGSSLSAQAAGGATATASADKEVESEYCESEESVSASAAHTTVAAAAASSSKVEDAKYFAATPSSSKAQEPKWTPSSSSTPAFTPESTTSTTPAPAPTTTQAPAPAQNNGGEAFNGGYATYFFQGGNAGACGTVRGDWDMVVAIDQAKWGSSSFGQSSPTCGRWLTVTNTNNGRSVVAMVADVCPTCANGNSLDLSQGAFNAIASESEGSVPISWRWN